MKNNNFILLNSYYNELPLIINVDNIIYINDYDSLGTTVCVNIFGDIKKYQVYNKFFDVIYKIKNLNNKAIYNFIYIDKDEIYKYSYSIILSFDSNININFRSSLTVEELFLNNNNILNNKYEKFISK